MARADPDSFLGLGSESLVPDSRKQRRGQGKSSAAMSPAENCLYAAVERRTVRRWLGLDFFLPMLGGASIAAASEATPWRRQPR